MEENNENEDTGVLNAPETSPTQFNKQMFMSNVPLPHKLNVKGNLANNWKQWKKVWNAYETVTELSKRESNYRVAAFITCIGPEALQIHTGLPFTNDDERNDIATVMKLWDDHCLGKTNVIYERYKFNNRSQGEHESVDEYVTVLRSLVETCEFQTLKDDLIRDRLVCGIRDNSVRRKLLQESKLTLERCVDVCRAAEATKNQLKDIASIQSKESSGKDNVNKVEHYRVSQKRGLRKPGTKVNKDAYTVTCKYCGKQHERVKEKCPAYGKKCAKCGKENHFAAKCRSKQAPKKQEDTRNVNTLSESSEEEELFNLTSDDIKADVSNSYDKKIYATMEISGQPVKMQVDSGASCNILPKKYLPPNTKIQQKDKELVMYSKTKMATLGTARIGFRNLRNNKKYRAEFVVIEGNYTPIIGARAAQQMSLIVVQRHNIFQVNAKEAAEDPNQHVLMKEDVLHDYHDVFNGLGKMDGKLHLEVYSSAQPVIMPPRRVPIAVKGKLKDELKRLEGMGVIAKQEAPTLWVSSLVVTEKSNGQLRVCIDPQHLNKAIKRAHYPLPVIEEVLPELADARMFSKLDLKDGFLQIELDEESSKLTTFQTPWGRYRWLRLPFGVAPAPENFQQKLDQNLEGLKGVYKIADDILVTGQGPNPERDHDINLLRLLQRCRERNIVLNAAKFEFKCTSVPFIGHTLTQNGLQPDPSKVEAITKMEKPQNVEAVRRLIGMVMYLSKFLNGLSSVCEPLRRLTHKDATWLWSSEHDETFEKIKGMVSSTPLLKYFNPSDPTEGQGDASSTGLGFVLTQNDQPVTFASRALTPAETRYSQIEKELLALVFGLEHNHQYVYGRKITLWTDHKPLVSISRKPLATAPKRLQRLLLRLQQYDTEIHYKPGKEMYVPDTLSRAHLKSCQRSETEEETEHVHAMTFLPMSQVQFEELKKESTKDDTIQQLSATIISGWPDHKSKLPTNLHPYYSIRDELSVHEGVVFKGQRAVIPFTMRAKMKDKVHAAHTGIQGCLRRAREAIYWPGMNKDLTNFIAKCDICASYQDSAQAKEPLIPHQTPRRPWEKIGVDIFTFRSKDNLCTVDYYSDYFEVDVLSSKTGEVVIGKLKKHFAIHGIPDVIHSDNGPPFSSPEFSVFTERYEIKHTTSSPKHPQSNGKVENAVKTAKNLLKKSQESGTDYHLTLLIWRNTPTEGLDSSPAQRLFGRRTRTLLPTTTKQLKPNLVPTIRRKESRKSRQAMYFNRRASKLPTLEQGTIVRVLLDPEAKPKRWHKGKIIKIINQRSYQVELEDGRRFRRNRVHLRTSAESFTPKRNQELEESEYDFIPNLPNAPPTPTPPEDQLRNPNSPASDMPNHPPQPGLRRSQRNTRLPNHLQGFVLY